jgi:hypothetical protein
MYESFIPVTPKILITIIPRNTLLIEYVLVFPDDLSINIYA